MKQKILQVFKKNNFFTSHITVALAVLLIVFLTPLKHLNIVEPTIKDVTPKEFYDMYTKNPEQYVFIDVRDPFAYGALHALGSISIPLHTLYDQRKVLPKHGKEVVLICTGGRASGVGYMYLQHYGFYNIMRVGGGIEAWVQAGLPTEGARALR